MISDGLGSRAAERLNRAISNGNISHAYIFEGDYTVDKTAFAMNFVKSVLCDSSGSIYSSISAIEEARRKILKNMNISYALKEMIIKIGG